MDARRGGVKQHDQRSIAVKLRIQILRDEQRSKKAPPLLLHSMVALSRKLVIRLPDNCWIDRYLTFRNGGCVSDGTETVGFAWSVEIECNTRRRTIPICGFFGVLRALAFLNPFLPFSSLILIVLVIFLNGLL